MIDIAANVARAREQIEAAARAAGRDPAQIRLCAATKQNDAGTVRRAIAAGVGICGENRVQELCAKLDENAYAGAEVHFIGHLQKNKAKLVVGRVDLIQSVDSPELLALIDRLAAERGIVQRVLLEVNIGGEAAKSGFAPEAVAAVCQQLGAWPHVRLEGLMAIPPRADTPGGNSRYFAQMQQLYVDICAKKYDNACVEILSMGMSGDFADAIAYGSTMVRLGTAIFGPRSYGVPASGS